jgi:hypothetical protein
MAILANTHPTLLDVAKRTDPNGNIADIVELLTQYNPMLEDMPWVEGNLPTGHRTTVRTGLPTPTWRKLYGGVQPGKGQTVQITDSTGMLEAYAEIDKALADLNGNTAAFRLSEDVGHIEGISQELASTIIYGNEVGEPEAFTGLAARFNDQSAANGENILTHAATPDNTDNTSLWVIGWGQRTVHGIYPKGSKAGLTVTDKGQVTVENAANGVGSTNAGGGRYEAYRTHYKFDAGLCVRDWRYIVRINFDLEDVNKLTTASYTGPDLPMLLAKALRRIPSLRAVRPIIYGNRDAMDALDLQFNSQPSLAYTSFKDAQGQMVQSFRNVPVKQCDAILSNEAGL